MQKANKKIQDSEKKIKMLTSQLAAASEAYRGGESGNLDERCLTPLHQIRFSPPYHPVYEFLQLQQQRGALKVYYHEEL